MINMRIVNYKLKKTFLTAVVLLSGMLILSSCAEKIVKYQDSGSTIHLKVGQTLKVELPGNASTGNDWRKMSYDDKVIMKKGKPNYVLADDRIGSAGLYYFKFKAVAPGVTKLYMEFGSKYDDSKDPVKTFELEIIVVGG
jgi:predicted secreted protein